MHDRQQTVTLLQEQATVCAQEQCSKVCILRFFFTLKKPGFRFFDDTPKIGSNIGTLQHKKNVSQLCRVIKTVTQFRVLPASTFMSRRSRHKYSLQYLLLVQTKI